MAGGSRAEESVAADLLKALGKDVLEKACDEGVDGKGKMLGLVCATKERLLPREAAAVILG